MTGCLACLHGLGATAATQESDEQPPSRLLQLVMQWLLADGSACARRHAAQRTMLLALRALRALPAELLPATSSLAPLGGLLVSRAPAVRLEVTVLLARMPFGEKAALPATPERGASDVLPGHVLSTAFTPPLLGVMTSEDDVGARLLAWAAALGLYERLEPAAQARLSAHWKQRQLPELLTTLLPLLPLDATSHDPPPRLVPVAELCAAALEAGDCAPTESELAVSLYLQLLRTLPALVRHWWTHGIDKRGVSASLARFTETFVSPLLLRLEVDSIAARSEQFDSDNFKLRGSATSRQIAATYSCEGSAMQIILTLSSCHPLRAVEVECVQRVGVSDARWKKWQRSISTVLLSQNGSIPDALLLWKQDVDKVFDGVEECPICYMIVHQATRQLPRLECKTCHNKFHAACLYKWFSGSQKSNCPLCQSTF